MTNDKDEEYRAWRRDALPKTNHGPIRKNNWWGRILSGWDRKLAEWDRATAERDKTQVERSKSTRRSVASRDSSAEFQQAVSQLVHGPRKAAMICPHCQTKGCVYTKNVKMKAGVSGGKATAAILTGGFSLFATGLSRKQSVTEAWCSNCQSTWHF